MDMLKLKNKFRDDEDGAVTVDWVVLTAAIVGLGIAVLASVRDGVETLGEAISTSVAGQVVGG
jgi:Flp pilus assembly pilin Flp